MIRLGNVCMGQGKVDMMSDLNHSNKFKPRIKMLYKVDYIIENACKLLTLDSTLKWVWLPWFCIFRLSWNMSYFDPLGGFIENCSHRPHYTASNTGVGFPQSLIIHSHFRLLTFFSCIRSVEFYRGLARTKHFVVVLITFIERKLRIG